MQGLHGIAHTSDQVILNTPISSLSPSAFHTAGDASTSLYGHGGSKLCSASQPYTESALVDDLGQHGTPVPVDADHLVAPALAVQAQPPRGQRHHQLGVLVEAVVAERFAAAVSTSCEAVQS